MSRAEVLRRFQSVLLVLFSVNDCNIQSQNIFFMSPTFCVKKPHRIFILGLCVNWKRRGNMIILRVGVKAFCGLHQDIEGDL